MWKVTGEDSAAQDGGCGDAGGSTEPAGAAPPAPPRGGQSAGDERCRGVHPLSGGRESA